MLHVDGERDRLSALAELMPVRADIADELRAVHPLGQLRLDVVAGLRADAAKIGIDRRVYASLDQVTEYDQLGHLGAREEGLEDSAEPATVAAAWRRRQAEQHCVRVCIDDLAVGLRWAMVRFIDHQ